MLTHEEVKAITRSRLFDLDEFLSGQLRIEEGYLTREFEENMAELGYLQRDIPIQLPSYVFPNGSDDTRTIWSQEYDGGPPEASEPLTGTILWEQTNLIKNGRLRYMKLHTRIGNQVQVCRRLYREIFLRVIDHLRGEVTPSKYNKTKDYHLFKIPVDKLGLELPETISYVTIYLFPKSR